VVKSAQAIVLLAGGSKRTQKTDITRTKALAARLVAQAIHV
jgi:putative component of toxin-antitoxin plasmid stabilization module